MSSKPLIKQNGDVNGTVKYLGKLGRKWLGVPACIGSQIKGPCSRIDLMKKHAGIDVQAMYPAGEPPKADAWTTDTFLKAAEACHKGGVPFGIGLGETSDSVDTVGAFFLAFGAQVVDAKGNVVVKNDNVRQALEYYKKLMAFLPPDVAGVGRRFQQQVAGFRQRRDDHESAERLGRGQARRAAGRRAMLDPRLPGRPEGPLCTVPSVFLERMELLQEQGSGKERAVASVATGAVEKLVAASGGYDLPAFEKLTTLKTGPRKARRRARSTTIQTRTSTRRFRSRHRRRRRRSPSKSTRRPP